MIRFGLLGCGRIAKRLALMQADGITVRTGAAVGKHRRPPAIRAVTRDPIFGRDYYEVLSSAKIVLNRSMDMPSANRGNVRCFEALASGSLLLTDEGNYPEGISNDRKRFEALVSSI